MRTLCSLTHSRKLSTKKTDHSVLTEQRDDESVQKVLAFFQEKLTPA